MLQRHEHPTWEAYFMPGELILLATHDNSVSVNEDILPNWVQNLWVAYQRANPNHNFNLDAQIKLLFTSSGDTTSTQFVKVTIPDLMETEDDTVSGHDEGEGSINRKAGQLVTVINELNKLSFKAMGISLQCATPNWMCGTMPHSLIHPSPGGWPVSVEIAPPPDEQTNLFDKTKVDDAIRRTLQVVGTGTTKQTTASSHVDPTSPVNVVILDTVPPPGALEAAYEDFGDQGHELLKSLRDKNVLHIHRATDCGIPLPPDPENNPLIHSTHKYYYKVSDHGLFIAGIVHDFAPNANIHLIEVLNPFGVGTVESMVAAIRLLTETDEIIDKAERNIPLVVNCSLAISFLDADELRSNGFEITEKEDSLQTMCELELLRQSLLKLENTFDHVRIIAAAGNEGRPGVSPPHAYCPAAFDFVLGVGAVEKDGTRAWYSNLGDEPGSVGLMVYGGNMTIDAAGYNVTEPNDGMLGVYIGHFPQWNADHTEVEPGPLSDNGWARWSGTSFAAGSVSGMFARAAAAGRDIDRLAPSDFYSDLLQESTSSTARGEPVLRTPQKV